ncbi:uncharacterized protein HD556DRAFT_1317682 [Suillus plorans]|uniref:Uncharacterized protein n=1 Tax=Suillus plorans TaxID=116603 RepID=A0A9P7J9N2_9AGAM|nr:uncharacterized protein HD556DRAFT_1317682 [Suillus plorans]KAG1810063.1 hypothetical protein HD556DRAFT_1317682 [Suillus plorans]
MATSSSSSHSVGDALSCPIALVVSDLKLPDDGSVNVRLTPVFWVRLQFVNQFPSGYLLPVTVLSLGYIIDHSSIFTQEQRLCRVGGSQGWICRVCMSVIMIVHLISSFSSI